MNYHKDELDYILNRWTLDELNDYIQKLEARVMVTKSHITELKQLRRKKSRRKGSMETGTRGGK